MSKAQPAKKKEIGRTLAFAMDRIAYQLNNRDALQRREEAAVWRSVSQVKDAIRNDFLKAIEMGQYSYDPVIGSLAVVFPHYIEFTESVNGVLIGTIVREYLEEDGWEEIILLPGVTGNHRARVTVQSVDLIAGELMKKER